MTLAVEASPKSNIRTVIVDDVVIGTGAVILNRGGSNLHIGDGATIGANAVVIRDVAAGQTVVGAPAHEVSLATSAFRPAAWATREALEVTGAGLPKLHAAPPQRPRQSDQRAG